MTKVRRRRSNRSGFLDVLFELTSMFWQFGAVSTAVLIILAAFAFQWVENNIAIAEASLLLAPMADAYGWLLYGLPAVLLGLACLFATKTLEVYNQ